MPDRTSPKLQLPTIEISRRQTATVSEMYKRQASEIASPFFEAGGEMICLAEIPEYGGNAYRTPSHRFDLIIQGRMEFRLGNKTIIAGPGDLVCTPAGTRVQRTGLEPIVWIYILFKDTPLWKPLMKSGPSIRPYESADIVYILVKRIHEGVRSQDLYSSRCAYEYSSVLVTLMQRELRDYGEDWQSERTDRLIDLVERIRENPGLGWTRASLAQDAGMSERNLTKAFDKVFGVSPGQMIRRVRMEHALTLLKEGNDTVEAIGEAVGYGSAVAFSNAFKKHAGTSPGKYREESKRRPFPSVNP